MISRFILAMLLLVLGYYPIQAEAGITANLHVEHAQAKNQFSSPPKLSMEGKNVRMDFKSDMGHHSTILNSDSQTVVILHHTKKQYMKVDMRDQNSEKLFFTEEGFHSKEEYEKKGWKMKLIGKEKLDGHPCKVYLMTHKKKGEKAKVWFAQDLNNLPIKSVSTNKQNEKISVALKDIKEGKLSAAVFQVPKSYQEIEMPKMTKDMGKMQAEMQKIMADPNLTQEQKQAKIRKMIEGMGYKAP